MLTWLWKRQAPVQATDWSRRKERSNIPLLRLMTWISLALGRPAGRVVLRLIAAYFTLFSPAARHASRAYLDRALGREANWIDGYRHVFTFASTIHDRIYLLNGRFDLFDIRLHGEGLLEAAMARGRGAILLGAHLGSFEVVRALGRQHPDMEVAITMYEENAHKLNDVLQSINPAMRQDVIALGRFDTMLRVRDYLDRGYMIGMLADRTLSQRATDPVQQCDFLGAPTGFPTGPLRMAAMLRRPVFFITGLYRGGNRYDVHFVPLADFSQTARGQREAAVQSALDGYVRLLEKFSRKAPYNWFNFYDFWHAGPPLSEQPPPGNEP
ncbi:acyl-CoA synthetase [Cupriavidus consociatus]|uniref:LpxL/LpxP family acyltransferase n=1 Tax=Cupriavidus consociatus TaxID=2821357 RepID=UPI001AE7F472|nr:MULTISPECIES: acyl-CoA synthetase [unclassified Cupriavidus]MBP0618967.1 acyl-CoA synthetase [Cupriavidus sp. LEh25]MDK2655612.1 acyl-CoA synthetase [Cupriavidus sp. LEh21]